MVKYKHRGKRSKTRKVLSKRVRQKGMPSPQIMLQKFKVGQRVHVVIDPSVHYGMPFRRFNGKTGVVEKQQGGCYLVKIKDMRAEKTVLAHPAHLRLQK
jgi:large subunit ribosomal protein L21e